MISIFWGTQTQIICVYTVAAVGRLLAHLITQNQNEEQRMINLNNEPLAISFWLLAHLITQNQNEEQRMINLNNEPLAISFWLLADLII